jgi:small subunit ribosomal protein S1
MLRYFPEGFLIYTQENLKATSTLEGFINAYNENRILEARTSYCDREHNLHIDFGFIHGIIPREECAIGIKEGTVKDIAIIARVNKPVKFKIRKITEADGKKTAILSRCDVQKEFTENILTNTNTGDIITAKITHLEAFGAFCDIGCGVNALLPIDNISVSRIPHPDARFNVGDDIKVIIKSFDEFGRVTLSHKELLGTWEENANSFNVGETVSGIVRSVESYGIFIELAPNLAGLSEYTSGVFEGQQASVYIKSIIPEKMKFKLIIVDAFDGECTKQKPKYFYEGNHIDYFLYSPKNSKKIIETFF